jgi:hypothetical protein
MVSASVSGRWAWRAEDDHPVARADFGESCDIRRSLGRRRQDTLGRVLADLSLESLELHRREADKCLRASRFGVKGVRHVLRTEREGSGL